MMTFLTSWKELFQFQGEDDIKIIILLKYAPTPVHILCISGYIHICIRITFFFFTIMIWHSGSLLLDHLLKYRTEVFVSGILLHISDYTLRYNNSSLWTRDFHHNWFLKYRLRIENNKKQWMHVVVNIFQRFFAVSVGWETVKSVEILSRNFAFYENILSTQIPLRGD